MVETMIEIEMTGVPNWQRRVVFGADHFRRGTLEVAGSRQSQNATDGKATAGRNATASGTRRFATCLATCLATRFAKRFE
jgi:hypothetical protein